ncbi:MAG: 30S ribosomal protein S16 [Lentisphaerae bacterium]|nr:30S ribosomal protein S16 [Lentisphaerota bacterium]
MVKIRMTRLGARNCTSFRVIATDSRSPRDGRALETLGWYDPKQPGVNFKIDGERVSYWRERGAQVSPKVLSLLKRVGRAARSTGA